MSGQASLIEVRLPGRSGKPGKALRAERRTVVLAAVLAVLIAGLGLLGLCYGDSWASPAEVLAALSGSGDSSVVIVQWRLPRVVAGIAFGAALGVAGSIFQNITRNPMGSPDVIGLDAGAYTGALFALTVFAGTSVQLAVSSVAGGLIAAAVVYLLSYRGGLSGLRLVVIGIAAVGWSSGSLNGIGWEDLTIPLAGLAVLMVLIGVGCTATVTAVAGPIAFIALAAPQIGRRLARAPGVPLLPAALTGAVLLQGADLVAQSLLAPVSLPVGVVTTVIGGSYLMWLLTREVRRR